MQISLEWAELSKTMALFFFLSSLIDASPDIKPDQTRPDQMEANGAKFSFVQL